MIKIAFTIHGNQEDPHGNPVPYTRVLNHSWRSDATKYINWCAYVRTAFVRALDDATMQVLKDEGISLSPLKPMLSLPKNKCAAVQLSVEWKNSAHGDLDNILKGILDALFVNDKCINGFGARAGPSPEGKGKVELIISISNKK